MFCGHPTYTPDLVNKISEMFEDGSSITKVCAKKLKITRRTYYEWKEKYPDFKEAAEHGEELAEAFHEERLDAGVLNSENFGMSGQLFLMRSRFRKTYSEQKADEQKDALVQALVKTINEQNTKSES